MAELSQSVVKLVYSQCTNFDCLCHPNNQGAILISFNECKAVGDLYRVMEQKYTKPDDIVEAIRRLREALKCSALAGFPRVLEIQE